MDTKIFLTIFLSVFIAELGDKTQLATMLFATNKEISKLTVFCASSLALIVCSGMGVMLGSVITQYVSENMLSKIAGFGFVAIGLFTLLKG